MCGGGGEWVKVLVFIMVVVDVVVGCGVVCVWEGG